MKFNRTMIYKNRMLLRMVVLFGGILSSCSKNSEQFILCSDEDGVICSAKSSFNDTIFYENRFPDTTVYYYAALTKYQNKQLLELIQNLKTEKSLSEFTLMPGSGTFIVASDKVTFYEANYSIPTRNTQKILTMFRDMSSQMKPCPKTKDFWNVEGVTPPDNPVP